MKNKRNTGIIVYKNGKRLDKKTRHIIGYFNEKCYNGTIMSKEETNYE
ncbi:MAG: hypothetical protein J6F30_13370 [Cellulosilyticum sp.]|nr:hypothetical protein [Cellulosilyticum sp.]